MPRSSLLASVNLHWLCFSLSMDGCIPLNQGTPLKTNQTNVYNKKKALPKIFVIIIIKQRKRFAFIV